MPEKIGGEVVLSQARRAEIGAEFSGSSQQASSHQLGGLGKRYASTAGSGAEPRPTNGCPTF